MSFFLNHALLAGTTRVPDPISSRKTLRPAVEAHRPYGVSVQPANLSGLVHHALARSAVSNDLLDAIGPHQTTVVDIVLPRNVHEGVFRLTQKLEPEDFSRPVAGDVIS